MATAVVSINLSLGSLKRANGIIQTEKSFVLEISNQLDEVQYLPKQHAIETITLGYKNVTAQIIWFYTQNYFGKHYRGDQKYNWLYHMCDLITTLDPLNKRAFKFAAFMLGWEAKKTVEARKILAKAMIHHPKDWEFYYIRGSLAYIVEDDPQKAIADFKAGALLPNAPSMMASVAATKIAKVEEEPLAAIAFLKEMLKNAKDPLTRASLKNKINDIQSKLQKTNP